MSFFMSRKKTTRRTSPFRSAILEALETRVLMSLSGNQLFPSDNPWNHNISGAPVAANSATLVSSIGASKPLHPDFGSGLFNGGQIGIPYNIVSGTQPKVNVVIDAYPGESDLVPVPIPSNAVIEGDPLPSAQNTADRHLLVYDKDNNIDYELFNTHRPSEEPDGQWHADSEAVWYMNQDYFRTPGFGSADAAGLPILTGLVRDDEVLTQGVINHALRFTVPQTQRAYVWPANHYASISTNTALPRMGERFRLKQSFNISGFSAADQVILTALKNYGMMVADNGGSWFLSGAPSDNWSNDDLHTLTQVLGSNLEAVDLTPVVSSLDTTTGSTSGGTSVTLHGVNYTGDAGQLQVYFGGVAATNVTVTNDNTLTATAPAHAAGTVDVTIVTPYGTSVSSSADKFTYAATGVTVSGNASNNVIYLRRDGSNLDEWIDASQPGQGTPTHVDSFAGASSLSIQGGGGSDAIIIDQTGGNIFTTPTAVANAGGSVALTVLGTTGANSLSINGAAGTLTFDSATLNYSNVASIEYFDTSGNDTLESNGGGIAVTLDATDMDDITIDSGTVTINIVQAGTVYSPPTTAKAAVTPKRHAPAHRLTYPKRSTMTIAASLVR
jgi:hypothetical protein